MAPLVSVVVPAFDALRYLREVIACVRGQTHNNLALVIADDGSRESSRQVLEESEHPANQVVRHRFGHGTNVIGAPLAVLFRREALLTAMAWVDTEPLMLNLVTYKRVADLHPHSHRRGTTGVDRRIPREHVLVVDPHRQ